MLFARADIFEYEYEYEYEYGDLYILSWLSDRRIVPPGWGPKVNSTSKTLKPECQSMT